MEFLPPDKTVPLLHDIRRVEDGLFNTRYGNVMSLRNPTAEMICIEDIANSLSKTCRWGCQIEEHFSVAQHSILVSYLVPQHLRFAALMHDAAEAYLGDIKKPYKILLGRIFYDLEFTMMQVICEKFRFKYSQTLEVKPWDLEAQDIEFEYFFKGQETRLTKAFGTERTCWSHEVAREMFLSTFNELNP